MIQGNRAAGLTHMDQCSSRRTVLIAEKMIFVDACYFSCSLCLGPRCYFWHGRQLLVSLDYLNAKSENNVCASKCDRGVVKFIECVVKPASFVEDILLAPYAHNEDYHLLFIVRNECALYFFPACWHNTIFTLQ